MPGGRCSCCGHRGDLAAHAGLGQIGQHCRVVLAFDQGLEHCPARDTDDVGRDRGEFDSGVLQHLLQPLDLPTAFIFDRGAGPGQIMQQAEVLGRDSTGVQQTVRA